MMPVHHDPSLVAASIAIALLASYTTLDLTSSLVLARGRAFVLALSASALAMGTGIWSMHFTGMLAFQLAGNPISYELKLLAASIVIAVAASAVALFVFTRKKLRRMTIAAAGFAMGGAISGMHYTGMGALRAPVRIEWNYALVLLSITIAVAASFVALKVAARIRVAPHHAAPHKFAGGAILGVAIAGMHYTAMAAASFSPAPLAASGETRLLATSALALAVIASATLVLAIAITTSVATRSIARRTSELVREQQFSARIRESEEYYRALIDNASDLIVVVDEDGKRRFVSSSYQRILGYDPEELIGKDAFECVDAADQTAMRAGFADLVGQPGTRTEYVSRVRHKDGSLRTLRVVAQNLLHHPSVRGIVMAAQDETERRRLEEQIQQSQKMEAIGKLAGGIAHDFNNLLTVIIGNTSALMTEDECRNVREQLREIYDAAARAAGLTRQLLAFSRRQVLQLRTLDLNESVRAMQSMIRRLLEEDIEVQTRLVAPLPPIRADAGQIEQVLLNLAINSRDAMEYGGLLTMQTSVCHLSTPARSFGEDIPVGEYVCLEVTDSGCGMEPAVLARIFEPFFTTKEVGKGTGIGLATVYGIMKQSGGYITVRSAPQMGTTFRLLFPPSQEPLGAASGNGAARSERSARETILLIEDEEPVRVFTKRTLERAGYQVLDAGSGLAAIDQVRTFNGPIHLILSDVVLPDINGRETVDRIGIIRPGARVVFMSGYTEDEIIHRGVLSSGVNFLQKPFTSTELIEKISRVFDS